MKKLLLILLITVQGLTAQNLDSLKAEYIKCNKYGKLIENTIIHLFYARKNELDKPYNIYLLKQKDSVNEYKVLLDPMVNNKRLMFSQFFEEIIEEETLESNVKL